MRLKDITNEGGDEDCVIQVDHIRARSRYPELSLDLNNLQVLCKDCNEEKGTNTKDYRPVKRRIF